MDSSIDHRLRQRKVALVKKTSRGPLVLLLCAILCAFGTTGYMVDTLAVSTSMSESHKIVSSPQKTQKAVIYSKPHAQKPIISHPTTIPVSTKTSISSMNYPISSGNKARPEIALTFDDGPNPSYTPQVLAVLQRFGIQATFFDIGYLVKDYPALVQQEYSAGHIVGQHSWSHPDLTRLSVSNVRFQLATASDAIQSAIGRQPAFFRPPYGAVNSTVMQQAKALNLSAILWNDDPRDWSLPGVNVIIQRAVGEAHNGTIILMHDGGGNRSQTIAALPTIITTLQSRGFRFVTMQQLVQDNS